MGLFGPSYEDLLKVQENVSEVQVAGAMADAEYVFKLTGMITKITLAFSKRDKEFQKLYDRILELEQRVKNIKHTLDLTVKDEAQS